MLPALYGGATMKVFGLGLVAALVGVMVSLPLAVRPLAALIATPLRLRGLPGELAKQNAMRNPRRTVVDGCGPDDRPHPGREHERLRLVAEGRRSAT